MTETTEAASPAPPKESPKPRRERKPKPAPTTPRGPLPDLATAPEVLGAPAIDTTALNTMKVSLNLLDPDPSNVRASAAPAQAEMALRASMSAVGCLEAPTVRAHPTVVGRWMVVIGHRRVAAARALGWSSIRCLLLDTDKTDAEVAAIQAAENLVRADMHSVDRWLAVQRMVDGLGERDAHAAAGISQREGALFARLAKMHPDVIAILRRAPMHEISARHIATISGADPIEQAVAVTKIPAGVRGEPSREIASIASFLTVQRITADRAIFDLTESHLDWVEDLFADPTYLARFSTGNVKGFLREQAAALQRAVDLEVGKGHPIRIVEFDAGRGDMAPMPGWDRSYQNAEKPLPKGSTDLIAVYIRTAGHSVGQVVRQRMTPKPTRAAGATGGTAGGDKVDRGPVTQKGLGIIAEAQEVALHAALDCIEDPTTMLAALVIAIGGRNVYVRGSPHNVEFPTEMWGRNRFAAFAADLAAQCPGKHPREFEGRAMDLARETIKRMVVAPAPKRADSSGKTALYLGEVIGAENHLPRLDTMAFLSEVAGSRLEDLCRQAGKKPGKTGAMRSALAGALPPPWRPSEAAFGPPTAEELKEAQERPTGGDGGLEGEDPQADADDGESPPVDAPPVFGGDGDAES